ncbi:response regulator receiver domain-containing protein [Litorimonas taeanensis]|uniref:Response regulator receiver domain-containing protein n=1 Tax=Litorimonas taeanensis TaxID=568099 RepID=A0A420WMC5_9PROT|nr:response regulator [Litorimonas taeanensis]RKQ72174.1 response regulator receiver domain-containing protein [Litorimonas taeanensis]
MIKVLIIDDELAEKELIACKLTRLFGSDGYSIHHAFKCSEAIKLLLQYQYDFVLLDNNLAASISGQFSVPIIKQYVQNAKLVIISNNIDEDYLQSKTILGVDDIVDKAYLEDFFRAFYGQDMTTTAPIKVARSNVETAAL